MPAGLSQHSTHRHHRNQPVHRPFVGLSGQVAAVRPPPESVGPEEVGLLADARTVVQPSVVACSSAAGRRATVNVADAFAAGVITRTKAGWLHPSILRKQLQAFMVISESQAQGQEAKARGGCRDPAATKGCRVDEDAYGNMVTPPMHRRLQHSECKAQGQVS